MIKTQLNSKTYTLEEYLHEDSMAESFYELEAGIIKEMPPESPENVRISLYLMMLMANEVGISRVSNKTEIIISGSKVTARIPDITVFTEDGGAEMSIQTRSTITLDMLPPLLVVEVVSPGKVNRDRDYRYKRSEYAARGITFYWIIDPKLQKLTALRLVDGLYEEQKVFCTEPFDFDLNIDRLFVK